MVMEYIECGVQLLFILIALLFSLFRYISCKKKGWLYAVGFFVSNLLSSYFWTFYLIIMREDPNTSSLVTNFGWNTSFFILLLLNLQFKTKEERRYFHPLILLPVPLNALQLMLYAKFGGVLNSVYQVSVCTLTACCCIQSILWYRKNRSNGVIFPCVAIVSLINVTSEFGMWTSTCFDGWVRNLYYPASFLSSLTYLMMLKALKRRQDCESCKAPEVNITRRLQNLMKGVYAGIVAVSSVGSIILCSWIRNLLTVDVQLNTEEDVYSIISAVLFLISAIIAVFAVAIVLIVYFEQKITENNRLREEKEIAERSNASKSEFLANMSHEIRTPINAVLGMNKMIILKCENARERLPAGSASGQFISDVQEYAGNIESAGNNLLSIINDILDFSKIEAGKLDITGHEYMLSSLLNDVSNLVLFRARDKGLAFNVEVDGSIPDRLFGDDVRIRQVIGNLLTNAVKYTDSGSVTLAVSVSGEVKAGESAELAVTVRDTGIGIRSDELEKIFDKFERTDLERNSTVEGTGLGLAITYHLVSMMGGTLHVESEYGSGSKFSFRLPQRVVSEDPIGDYQHKFRRSLDTMTNSERFFRAPDAELLIVDDTRMNLMVAEGLLSDTQIKTDTAESGSAALVLTAGKHYDLILMDQRMPGMDGTETLQKLREQGGLNQHTPVICLTADAVTGAKERYLEAGFDDYLTKPIDSRKLKQLMMQYLPAEKLLPADEPSDVSDGEPDGEFAALARAGLDTASALRYCQDDAELYRLLLQEYVTEAPVKTEKLQKSFDSGAARDYAIVVHSLKSTSRTIGAADFAERAALLEKAADREQWDILREGHTGLLEGYRELVTLISDSMGFDGADVGVSADDEILEFFPS